MREAASPTTPSLYSGEASNTIRGCTSAWRTFCSTLSWMRAMISCRSLFCESSCRASSPAVSASCAESRWKADMAESNLPAALRRGAKRKPIWLAFSCSRLTPETCAREYNPCRPNLLIVWIPARTSARFSPASGAISATVPNATKSSQSSAFTPGWG